MTTSIRNGRRLETILNRVLSERFSEPTEAVYAAIDIAGEIDRLNRQIVEDAQMLAERFARYAADIARGYSHATPPTGYSTVRDLPENAVRVQTKREALSTLLRVAFGSEVREAFNAAVAEVVAAEQAETQAPQAPAVSS